MQLAEWHPGLEALGKTPLQAPSQSWQNSIPCGCRTESPVLGGYSPGISSLQLMHVGVELPFLELGHEGLWGESEQEKAEPLQGSGGGVQRRVLKGSLGSETVGPQFAFSPGNPMGIRIPSSPGV